MPAEARTPPDAAGPVRIAMWSGPRNISTAMMRSWENRSDTAVADEPFYAHYLRHTGADHPGRDEVVAHHETDWRKVVAFVTGPAPDGAAVFYQKQMTHHLLPHVARDWLGAVRHAFLIRAPRAMLASLAAKIGNVTVEETGLPQQLEIFERVRALRGAAPPVVDAADVQQRPAEVLPRLCDALGVPFDAAMLRWPPGPRASDGVWGKYWYESVYETTGFRAPRPQAAAVPRALHDVLARCEEIHAVLAAHKL